MALGARLVGAALLLAGLGLIAWNERRVMDYTAALARHGAPVLDLGAAGRPGAGQYGSLTRVSGMPQIVDAPRDAEFGVRADSPILIRHVEMFQWREITVGGNTHYELDWVDRPIDASEFAKPAAHLARLPGARPRAARRKGHAGEPGRYVPACRRCPGHQQQARQSASGRSAHQLGSRTAAGHDRARPHRR